MKVGIVQLFQNTGAPERDNERYRECLRLAELGEPLGFDSVWAVEHHFSPYSMTPNPLQFLAYMAGRTQRVQLGTMVVVLPWHQPVRVVGEVAQLDNLCGGRLLLGIGRGLGRLEFEGFGISMDESRARFVEAAELLLTGLETGQVEFKGSYYEQATRTIRPRPVRSFRGRTFASAVSPESSNIMARLGVALLIIPQKPWPAMQKDLDSYRSIYRDEIGEEAPPPVIAPVIFCDEDGDRAQELGRRYIGAYYESVVNHYELLGTHFAETKGYEYYAETREAVVKRDAAKRADAYVGLQVYGTPDKCFEQIMEMRDKAGADTFIANFDIGGMPVAESERNLRIFAEKVRPRLQALPPLR